MASTIVASPTQASQCSIGSWLVMMVALLWSTSTILTGALTHHICYSF